MKRKQTRHDYCPELIAILLFGVMMSSWAQPTISISTIEDMQRIGKDPGYPLDGHYALICDINASATRYWNNGKGFEPIGYLESIDDIFFEWENYPFTGVFDGQGHVITGLYINRPDEDAVGLFALVRLGGEIINLGIQGASVTGKRAVGGLVGLGHESNVSNCFFRGDVRSNFDDDWYWIMSTGGLIGRSQLMTVERSYAFADVYGGQEVGGLIGTEYGSTITQCYFRGTVTGKQYIGGLCGGITGRISECYVAAAVCGTGARGVFGVANKPALESIFWDQQLSGVTASGGGTAVIALTTAQMMSPDVYINSGWNFEQVWAVNSGLSYPYFQIWEEFTETVAPDLIGMTVGAATAALAEASLDVPTSIERYHATAPAGIIFDQIPAAGAVLNTGSPVTVVVSRSPVPASITIPDISGLTQDAAEGLLRAEGFSVGRISLRYDETTPSGLVLEQHPLAGTAAAAHSEVNIIVSNGIAPDDVIPISSLESLQQIGNTPEYPHDGHYILTKDIDASATSQWNKGAGFVPLCMAFPHGSQPFRGTFDGQGYVITGLYINHASAAPAGLFSTVGPDAVVRSVALEACMVLGGDNVGGLAGQVLFSVIDNCLMHGIVTAAGNNCGGLLGDCVRATTTRCRAYAEVWGGGSTGGLVGRDTDNEGVIQECRFEGQVTGTGNVVGGLVGFASNILQSRVQASVTGNGYYVGGLAGSAEQVRDCIVEVVVEGAVGFVGGLIGLGGHGVTVSDCFAKGTVTTAGDYAGGLIGHCQSIVSNSSADTVVSGNNSVGGLIGYYMCNDNLRGCHAKGMVFGVSDVGGLIGYNGSGTVEQCYATAAVIATGNAVGGLIGRVYRRTTWMCYATGSVSAPDGNAVGGLIGHVQGSSSYTRDCYALGTVTGNSGAGGLIGSNEGNLYTSYAAGMVADAMDTGGLIGLNTGSVISAFWDTTISGMTQSAGGTGVPIWEMMQQTTFTAGGHWDFDAIWSIDNGKSYPYLQAIPSPASPRLVVEAAGPRRQIKAPGDFVEFTVAVIESIGEPAYQWKHRTTNKGFEYIPDANGPVYSIDFILEEHEGDFVCDVSDMVNTVSSPVFTLTLTTSLSLSPLLWLMLAILMVTLAQIILGSTKSIIYATLVRNP